MSLPQLQQENDDLKQENIRLEVMKKTFYVMSDDNRTHTLQYELYEKKNDQKKKKKGITYLVSLQDE